MAKNKSNNSKVKTYKRLVLKLKPGTAKYIKVSGQVKIDSATNERIINCPKCGKEMVKRTNGKFVVDVCANGCGGVFLDKNEINNINKQGFIHYIINYFRK